MAVPTITSLNPAAGHTGGKALVRIIGTNFRLSPAPPAAGVVPPERPTVAVTFGGVPATEVGVVSATELQCVTPANDVQSATVTVQNLDDDGAPIAGELATAAGAFAYDRVQLASSNDAALTRLMRAIRQMLARQVIPEVVFSSHTDYDDETGDQINVAALTKVPALVLVGPRLKRNRAYEPGGGRSRTKSGSVWKDHRVPRVVDAIFTLGGVTNQKDEALNLMAEVESFFARNFYVELPRDPDNLSLGNVRFELEMTPDGECQAADTPSEANAHAFTAEFMIRAFPIEAAAGKTDDDVVARGSTVATDGVGINLQTA